MYSESARFDISLIEESLIKEFGAWSHIKGPWYSAEIGPLDIVNAPTSIDLSKLIGKEVFFQEEDSSEEDRRED